MGTHSYTIRKALDFDCFGCVFSTKIRKRLCWTAGKISHTFLIYARSKSIKKNIFYFDIVVNFLMYPGIADKTLIYSIFRSFNFFLALKAWSYRKTVDADRVHNRKGLCSRKSDGNSRNVRGLSANAGAMPTTLHIFPFVEFFLNSEYTPGIFK